MRYDVPLPLICASAKAAYDACHRQEVVAVELFRPSALPATMHVSHDNLEAPICRQVEAASCQASRPLKEFSGPSIGSRDHSAALESEPPPLRPKRAANFETTELRPADCLCPPRRPRLQAARMPSRPSDFAMCLGPFVNSPHHAIRASSARGSALRFVTAKRFKVKIAERLAAIGVGFWPSCRRPDRGA